MLKSNNLSNDNGFLDYLMETDESLYYDIEYRYGFDMTKYMYSTFDVTVDGQPITANGFASIDQVMSSIQVKYDDSLQQAMGVSTDFVRQYIPTASQMPNSEELISDQYDVLYGKMPSFEDGVYNEAVLVVDSYNGVSDMTLAFLGLIPADIADGGEVTFRDTKEVDLESIVTTDTNEGKKFYIANNDLMYSLGLTGFTSKEVTGTEEGLDEIKIVGILRAKEGVDGILNMGLNYTPALTRHVIEESKATDIVEFINNNGALIQQMYKVSPDMILRGFAGKDTPSQINIYAKNFDAKEEIKTRLDAWNNRYEDGDENIVAYSDMMDMMFSMLSTMVDAVSYVLIAFTSISLVVSSVMIGIITYTSVVERTKEIGVLRSLGASKGEISNVFNAETFLIGLFAGLIGIVVTYLLSIPINLILSALVPAVGNLASLAILDAVILVLISIALTLIAGLVPARIASKKDPVVALRTE